MRIGFKDKFRFCIGDRTYAMQYRTSRLLEKLFRKYNKQYFGKRLCLKTVIGFVGEFPDPGHKNRLGCTYIFGPKSERSDGIFIHWKTTKIGGVTEMILLHEMIHLDLKMTNDDHGPRFDKEIVKLVKAGAYKGIL